MRPFFGLDDFAGFGKITNLESVTTGDTKMMVVSKTETTTSHRLVVAKNATTTKIEICIDKNRKSGIIK